MRRSNGSQISAASQHRPSRCSCAPPRSCLLFRHKTLQGLHVSAIIAGRIDRRFCDKAGMRQFGRVQEIAKWFQAEGPLPDVLVAVELGAAGSFSVVAMPDANLLEADRCIQLGQCLSQTRFAHNIVARNVYVTRVNARANRNHVVQRRNTSATCSKLPPSEYSAPAVFSMRMASPPLARSRPRQATATEAATRVSPSSRLAPRNEPGCTTRYSAQRLSARSTSPRNASTDLARNSSVMLAM